MDKYNTEALVQLAAIVYSNSDETINNTKKEIVRKIIQLSIFQNGNEMQTISEINTYIKDTFGLIFVDEEIWDIIKLNMDIFYVNNNNNDQSKSLELNDYLTVALVLEEYTKISTSSNTMSLNKIISNFYNDNYLGTKSLEEVTEILLKFIYNSFASNLRNYSNLIHNNSNRYSEEFLQELKDTLVNRYTDDEESIINMFIDYEDIDKNKYIFYM